MSESVRTGPDESSLTVVALLACHDRRDLTLRCLRSFFAQTFTVSPPELRAIVVDDGSTDGTTAALRAEFDRIHVITGDGTLFWARAMALAESHATGDRPEFLLWLNDDVSLDTRAVDRLLAVASRGPEAIVVGALADPDTSAVTYSGVVLSRWHPLRFRLVEPGDDVREADTFNGNVVLVPRSVSDRVGPIDGRFSHAQADFDYGLRARRAGIPVLVAPGMSGICRRGNRGGTFLDQSLSLRQRWRLIREPTGLPMHSHARYLRRHGGRLWPLFWAIPYLKLVWSALATAPRRARSRS